MVVLDEPCSGVDMKARKNIWDLISVLRQGRAVALATHYLDEAEHLSDSILIMNEVREHSTHDYYFRLINKLTKIYSFQTGESCS